MKPVLNALAVIVIAACCNNAAAFLPESNPVPGGVAVVPLVKSQTEKPLAWFGRRRLLVTQEAGTWYAIIGLGVDQVPGQYIIKFSTDSLRETTQPFNVYTGSSELSKAQDSNTANNDSVDNKQQKPEFLNTLEQLWTDTNTPDLPLHTPVTNITANLNTNNAFFGLAYDLPTGVEILTPAAGTVALAQDSDEFGHVLAIHHGRGLISLFLNLNNSLVTPEQRLPQSEVIAVVSVNKKEAQAPLLWVVILNGNQINPHNLLFKTKPER